MPNFASFNNDYQASGNACFFAFQGAFSSYPGDSLRSTVENALSLIQASSIQEEKAKHTASLLRNVIEYLNFLEYAVWDYSLVAPVAKKEFTSWLDGVKEAVLSPTDEADTTNFLQDETSYVVLTFVLISEHSSLRNWLAYYPENLLAHQFFERKTMDVILRRFADGDSQLLNHCLNAFIAVTPTEESRFFSAAHLRSDDWSYLRPVY